MSVEHEFAACVAAAPLPEGWAPPELFQDSFVLGELKLSLVGVSTVSAAGEMVTGSAAESRRFPTVRAYTELVERVATVEACRSRADFLARPLGDGVPRHLSHGEIFPTSDRPDAWQHAKSNGIAAGLDPSQVELSACMELLERDAVLRSWRGETTPQPTSMDPISDSLQEHYELRAVEFPQPGYRDCHVAGVFALARHGEAPAVFGFGAAPTLNDALSRARGEMLQRLAFLWGEPIEEDPPFAPGALYHQERFLHRKNQELLTTWLDGGHRRFASDESAPVRRCEFSLVDLTPSHLRGKLSVVKALSDECLPLTFGQAPIGNLPEHLWVHPIA